MSEEDDDDDDDGRDLRLRLANITEPLETLLKLIG